MISINGHVGPRVEEVGFRIIPAMGITLEQAVEQSRTSLNVDYRGQAILFKKKPQASMEVIDGMLYVKCPLNPDHPEVVLNIADGVVIGQIRGVVVMDMDGNTWAQETFPAPMDMSEGGLLTARRQP